MKNTSIIEACPLCKGTAIATKFNTKPIKIVGCMNCGLNFSAEQMNIADVESYYVNDFSSERHRKGQMINSLVNVELMIAEDISFQNKNILDVGCGYGYLIKRLKKKCEDSSIFFGVEISNVEREHAKNLLGQAASIVDQLEKFDDNSFDIIVCFEVIEHIKNPLTFINSLYKKLKKNGQIFVLTDNFGAGVVRTMGENYPKWIPHSHIVHFTPESFRRLFMESDFKCEPIVRFYTPFEIYIVELFYKIKRLFRRKIEIDFSKYEEDEFSRDLRFFRVRAAISLIVVKVFGSSQYDGSLMYSCVTKR